MYNAGINAASQEVFSTCEPLGRNGQGFGGWNGRRREMSKPYSKRQDIG